MTDYFYDDDDQAKEVPDEIEFDNDRLIIVRLPGEGIVVPIRRVCQAIGLDIDSQMATIQNHEVLRRGIRVVQVTENNRLRTLAGLLHKYLHFWLATISPHLVNDAARPKLVRYQTELVELLDSIYGTNMDRLLAADANLPPHIQALQQQLYVALQDLRRERAAFLAAQATLTTEVLELRQGLQRELTTIEDRFEHIEARLDNDMRISAAQQEHLKRSIQHLAHRYQQRTGQKIYDRLFSQFCLDLGTPRYDALPAGRYPDALAWVRRQADHYLPDDPGALPPQQGSLL